VGNYNSQYESYYSKLGAKKSYSSYNGYSGYGNGSSYKYNSNKNNRAAINGDYFIKRLMRELMGVLCLFLIIVMCKVYVTPETTSVLKYSKKTVDENLDYAALLKKMGEIRYSDVQAYADNLFKNIRIKAIEE
jgi:hypothetical protein